MSLEWFWLILLESDLSWGLEESGNAGLFIENHDLCMRTGRPSEKEENWASRERLSAWNHMENNNQNREKLLQKSKSDSQSPALRF